TINNPKRFCSNIGKAYEHFEFVNLDRWQEDDLKELLFILEKELKLNLSHEESSCIIQGCQGSPRYLKRAIKKFVMFYPKWPLERIIQEMQEECI
ncbi:MAG: hypothetical protein P8078_13560, partial [bacterium]